MPTVAGIHPSAGKNADRLRIRTVVDRRTGRERSDGTDHRGKRTADSQIKDIPLHHRNSSPACPLIYFISIKAKRIACVVSAVIFVATSRVSPLTGFAFWETNLAYEGESIYNYLHGQEPLRPHDPVHQRAVRRAVRHDERQRTDRYVLTTRSWLRWRSPTMPIPR